MKKRRFIIAVSGGVDSTVLLHKLMINKPSNIDYVVAHVDHNVRATSSRDAVFVKKMALKYNLPFRKTTLKNTSSDEQTLREKRYEFLFKLKVEYNAEAIITAHHKDDILESMIINMIRGTSPRGLVPMTRRGILRPLLHYTKQDIVGYAKKHRIVWVEDETNDDDIYLRNYVRKNVVPKLSKKRDELFRINTVVANLYEDIDIRVGHLTPKRNIISRNRIIQLPHSVAKEVIRSWLIALGIERIDKTMVEATTIAVKTLPTGKKIDIGKKYWLISQKGVLLLVKK